MTKNLEESLEPQQEHSIRRDPEDRPVVNNHELKDKMLDKTLADSFPTSDPPSTIPNPGNCDSQHTSATADVLAGMPPGSWAAVSIDTGRVVGKGASREEAESHAKRKGHGKLSLVQVPAGQDGTTAA